MTGLLFAHPEWLSPLVAGWVALALAVVIAIARGRKRLRALIGVSSSRPGSRFSRQIREAALLSAAALIAVGLLGPRGGERIVQLSTSGVDVVLLVDASRSMDAADVPPSRIVAGRAVARQVLAGLASGDRAALAAFSGHGVLLTPLTPDHAVLAETLSAIDSGLVKPGGSNIAEGIAAALQAFQQPDNRPRAIFVISDGEVRGPGGLQGFGAVEAARANARIFAVAIGTEHGATVPDHGVPLRDSSGAIVTSRRRTATLEKLANATGGRLFVADEWGGIDHAALLAELRRPVASAPGRFAPHRITVPVVLPFAAFAFVLLLGEWLPVAQMRRPHGSRRFLRLSSSRLAGVLLLLLLGVTGAAEPDGAQGGGTSRLELGEVLRAGLEMAERGAWIDAEHAFLAAALRSGPADERAIAFHNLGVAATRRDDFEAARDAYFEALALEPAGSDAARRERTQWNLDWVLGRLAELTRDGPDPEPTPSDDPAQSDEELEARPEEQRDDTQQAAPPMSRPSPAEAAPDEPQPGSAGQAAAEPADITLDEAERARWLARVTDDPRKAMLSAAFDANRKRDARVDGSPTW